MQTTASFVRVLPKKTSELRLVESLLPTLGGILNAPRSSFIARSSSRAAASAIWQWHRRERARTKCSYLLAGADKRVVVDLSYCEPQSAQIKIRKLDEGNTERMAWIARPFGVPVSTTRASVMEGACR